MRNLKELSEKCTLLCEHRQPAFMVDEFNSCSNFVGRANICKLFTDNKGNFFLYKRITDASVQIFTNYSDAIRRYIEFINTCM